VVCLASGPSLTREDVESVRGKAKVIAINASYALAPWADALYCADAHPFKWYWEVGPKGGYEHVAIKDFAGLKYSVTGVGKSYTGVNVIGRGRDEGLSLDPAKLCLGRNSGYQAINLAVLLGASRIILLGYDMGVSNGREHWHPERIPWKRSPYQMFRTLFPSMVKPLRDAGVEVINCSRQSALTCFPRHSLAEAFAMSREVAA